MVVDAHKYYCSYCGIHLLGDTVGVLVLNLNSHNHKLHPSLLCGWIAKEMVKSVNYSEPGFPARQERIEAAESKALSKYTEPYGLTVAGNWGDAKKAPVLTDSDRKLLARGMVKWD